LIFSFVNGLKQPAMDPQLSIIIVAYKSEAEIGDCLSSLPRTLSGCNLEVIVVDNSPSDAMRERVMGAYPSAKYIAAPRNLGFGGANNLGYSLTTTTSRFVLFLNPDTVCNEPAISVCMSRLEADANIGLISPRLVLADGSMDLACRRSIPTLWDGFCRASGLAAKWPSVKMFSRYNLTHLPANGSYEVGAINGAFMMGRRSVFEGISVASVAMGRLVERPKLIPEEVPSVTSSVHSQANASELHGSGHKPANLNFKASAVAPRFAVFDESFFMYGDDLDLCIRVTKAGWRIVYDGSASIIHLKGTSVAKDYDRMSKAIFDANRDVYLKHFNPSGSRWIRWKFLTAFGLWKFVALVRAKLRGHRAVRPV
jgi:N-acetylglucosaminyl-diphospho-decaprenol L-rhamnosyltransferase